MIHGWHQTPAKIMTVGRKTARHAVGPDRFNELNTYMASNEIQVKWELATGASMLVIKPYNLLKQLDNPEGDNSNGKMNRYSFLARFPGHASPVSSSTGRPPCVTAGLLDHEATLPGTGAGRKAGCTGSSRAFLIHADTVR
jgi:hypothetical protein